MEGSRLERCPRLCLACLRDVARTHGGAAIGGLLSPHATLEEMYLAQKLLRGLGSENIDFRLRQSDFSATGIAGARPGWA